MTSRGSVSSQFRSDDRFDGLFTSVAQSVDGIEPLLDLFFGFLQRRTDFFVSPLPSPPLTSPPTGGGTTLPKTTVDLARQLVLSYFDIHSQLALSKQAESEARQAASDAERRRREEAKRAAEVAEYEARQQQAQSKGRAKAIPRVTEIFEVQEESSRGGRDGEGRGGGEGEGRGDAEGEGRGGSSSESHRDMSTEGSKASGGSEGRSGGGEGRKQTQSSGDAEEEEEEGGGDGDAPPVGNGGETDKYRWVQTLDSVEVFIPIPPGTKSSSLSVVMSPKRVSVGLKGQPPIIDGEWHMRIIADESFWTLCDRTVQLTVDKFDKMRWWSCVVKGDPQINTQKIVPENSKLSDLDRETRSTVEKMMFDQQQKAQGKPTSDQMKQHELLEQFKKQHPQMDFSKANINWGGGGMS